MAKQSRNRIKEIKSYFIAAEAVSKPVAFLMLFFAVSFLASMAVGLFLVGRWGYERVVKVDEPVVVTTTEKSPNKEVVTVPDGPPSKSTPVEQPNKSSQTQSPSKPATTNLPDTGVSLSFYLLITVIGVTIYQTYIRAKNRT
jgi:hypothetical protein